MVAIESAQRMWSHDEGSCGGAIDTLLDLLLAASNLPSNCSGGKGSNAGRCAATERSVRTLLMLPLLLLNDGPLGGLGACVCCGGACTNGEAVSGRSARLSLRRTSAGCCWAECCRQTAVGGPVREASEERDCVVESRGGVPACAGGERGAGGGVVNVGGAVCSGCAYWCEPEEPGER